MTNRANLLLSIQANTDALNEVSTKLDRIGQSSQRAAQQTTSAFDRIKEHAAGVFTGTELVKILEMAGKAALDLAGDALRAGEGIEQLRVRYTNLLGSSSAANAEIAKLQQIANNSAFSLPTLAEGEARLISTGKSAEQARQIMIAVGNTAAGIGQNNEGIDGITTALTQIANKGKLSSEELGQLSERGVNGLQLLARALNLTTGETQKLVEQGRISADVFLQAFQADSQQRFGNAMSSNAQTMQGLLSTAGDLKDSLLAAFATETFTAIEPVLARILTELQNPQTVENIKEMGREFGKVAAAIGAGAEELGKLLGLIDDKAADPAKTAAAQITAAQNAIQAAQQAMQAKPIQLLAADNKEQITAINREIETARARYDQLIDAARERLRVENESYQTAVRARDLARSQAKVSRDAGLATDLFTSAGQAARDRLPGEQERVADLQFQQAHEQRVAGIEADIRKQERARDLALDSLQKQKRASEEATGAARTQANAILGVTNNITNQIAKVQALALAYRQLFDAQEGEREGGRTGVVNANKPVARPSPLGIYYPPTGLGGSNEEREAYAQDTSTPYTANPLDPASWLDLPNIIRRDIEGILRPKPEALGPVVLPPMGPNAVPLGSYNPASALPVGSIGTANMGGGTAGTVQIKVYIGDQELKGIIKTEIANPANGQALAQNQANYQRGRTRGWDR